MPEGPEVCITALYLKHMLVGKTLQDMRITGGRYKTHQLAHKTDFIENLPMKIVNVDSKGKFMWIEMRNSRNTYFIMNTFGMGGSWDFAKYSHSDIEFTVNGLDSKLYFTDPRHMGTIKFSTSRDELTSKLATLGPDLLKERYTADDFYNRVHSYLYTNGGSLRRGRDTKKIVEVLMNQTSSGGVGSGIGNYLVAEILYRAKISPHTLVTDLYNDREKLDKLALAIKYVIKLAFANNQTGYMDTEQVRQFHTIEKPVFHPETKLGFDQFEFKIYGRKKDAKGNAVVKEEIVKDRRTSWVPEVQS